MITTEDLAGEYGSCLAYIMAAPMVHDQIVDILVGTLSPEASEDERTIYAHERRQACGRACRCADEHRYRKTELEGVLSAEERRSGMPTRQDVEAAAELLVTEWRERVERQRNEELREATAAFARMTTAEILAGLDTTRAHKARYAAYLRGEILEQEEREERAAEVEMVQAVQVAIEEMDYSDPETLWTSGRPEIMHIMNMARRTKLSPWAILGATITRAACTIPYYVPFESFKGKRPINLLTAMTGGTGAGKTATEQTAGAVFQWRQDLGHTLEAGSGEAIASAYAYVAQKEDKELGIPKGGLIWRDEDHRARFMFDEIGRLNAIQGRQGATVLEYLKSGESGASLGRILASGEGVQIPAGDYRLVATMNIQPERAHLVLSPDEVAGGFPGRMLWFDTRYRPFVGLKRDRRPVEAFPLANLNWTTVQSFRALDVMDDAFEEQDDLALEGKLDAMESHANLLRAKVAVCLAVLAGRQALIESDWVLAGLVMEHSRTVRKGVLRTLVTAEETSAGVGDARTEQSVITRMMQLKAEGLTMAQARKTGLRSDRRKVWEALIVREPGLRW